MDLDDLARLVAEAPQEELPLVAGKLEEARARCWARLSSPASPAPTVVEKNVSVEDAATRMGISKAYVYKQAKSLPFVRRIGRRVVCSSSGLDSWIKRRRV
jgi:predicted DNA-binding transcriptional regulator AlpA